MSSRYLQVFPRLFFLILGEKKWNKKRNKNRTIGMILLLTFFKKL